MASSYYSRQNHKKAVTYLKAGLNCFNRERTLIYIVILCSSIFCVLGIIFTVLPQFLNMNDAGNKEHVKFMNFCSDAVSIVGFCSGLFLVAQLFFKIVTKRLHVDGVNAQEKFDNYVYNINPNKLITKPISEAEFESFAAKIKTNDKSYNNTYFSKETDDDGKVVYENQKALFINEYHLMVYVKTRFFNWIYGLFFAIIFGIALALNTQFFRTLMDIFFPSISVISIIVSSMLGYNQSMRALNNAISFFEQGEINTNTDKTSEIVLRLNQDAIFSYRMSSFTIPLFLVKRYEKSSAKKLRIALAEDGDNVPKTSPFVTTELEARYNQALAAKKLKAEEKKDKTLNSEKTADKKTNSKTGTEKTSNKEDAPKAISSKKPSGTKNSKNPKK